MMIRSIFVSASILALAATASASASEPASSAQKPHYAPPKAMLAPGDVASVDDAKRLAEAEFAKADANLDSAVSADEFKSYVAALAIAKEPTGGRKPALSTSPVTQTNLATASEAFSAIAGDDALITKDEMVTARLASFDRADLDRNKTLSASERENFKTLLAVQPDKTAPDL